MIASLKSLAVIKHMSADGNKKRRMHQFHDVSAYVDNLHKAKM